MAWWNWLSEEIRDAYQPYRITVRHLDIESDRGTVLDTIALFLAQAEREIAICSTNPDYFYYEKEALQKLYEREQQEELQVRIMASPLVAQWFREEGLACRVTYEKGDYLFIDYNACVQFYADRAYIRKNTDAIGRRLIFTFEQQYDAAQR